MNDELKEIKNYAFVDITLKIEYYFWLLTNFL